MHIEYSLKILYNFYKGRYPFPDFYLPKEAEEVFMKKIIRLVAATLLLSMLFACYGFVCSAAGESDFASAVDSINQSGSYLERKTNIDAIMALYGGLSDDEKNSVKEDYALALAELAAVEALAERAEAFIAAVESFALCSNLIDKERVLENATSTKFSDESYDGIADALAAYNAMLEEVEAKIAKCNEFIEYVDEITILEEDDYLGIRAALDAAAAVLKEIDMSYHGVSGAYTLYNEFLSAIGEKEYYTRDWVNSVKALKELPSYKYKRSGYEAVMLSMKNESFLPDYPAVAEAMQVLAEVEEYFRSCISAGNAFIRAVDDIKNAPTVGDGLINAYSKYKGVDKTVDGVSSAYATFDSMLDEYNDVVKQLNAWIES